MDSLVKCAACGTDMPAGQADIVTFGTGYRCATCTAKYEVHAHHVGSEAAWKKQDRLAMSFIIRAGIGIGVIFLLLAAVVIRALLR